MLVLTRKLGQSIYIGDEIKITLKEVKGNQIRLGIDAPPSMRIYREEIYLQILDENKSAAALSAEVPTDLQGVAEAWKGKRQGALDQLREGQLRGQPVSKIKAEDVDDE